MIKLLDCTLRDGGYTNNWNFGQASIERILLALKASKVDIIEVGYLRQVISDVDSVSYPTIEDANNILEKLDMLQLKNAIMIDFGSYPLERIPNFSDTRQGIKVIRLVFHKKDWEPAIAYTKALISKGYQVSYQPMAASTFDVVEFVNMLNKVNDIKNLYAFYIVDSFGAMYSSQVNLLFSIASKMLEGSVWIGFHSHNNLQLSYSLAMGLVRHNTTNRRLILDASIMGIGRGAGNLNMEIIIGAMNNMEDRYHVTPLFSVVDIVKRYDYGYDVPFYITAKLNLHPNYGIFVKDNLKDVTENILYKMLKEIDEDKKSKYDKQHILEISRRAIGGEK